MPWADDNLLTKPSVPVEYERVARMADDLGGELLLDAYAGLMVLTLRYESGGHSVNIQAPCQPYSRRGLADSATCLLSVMGENWS